MKNVDPQEDSRCTRAADDWDQFKRMLDRSFPTKGDQLSLRFDE